MTTKTGTATVTPNAVVYRDGVKLADAHREFKERMVKVLHDEARARGYCGDFDDVMIKAGLPGRAGEGYGTGKLVGERTRKEFQEWRRRTGRFLALMGARRSIVDYAAVLRRAGLATRKVDANVKIELTFRTSVDVMEDEDAAVAALESIGTEDQNSVHLRVNEAFRHGRVKWKMTVGD